MSTKPLTAVVTGANRGIGRAIVEVLSAKYTKPLTLYAVTRSGDAFDVKHNAGSVTLKFGRMALTNRKSMTDLAARIRDDEGSCDVLINNAGIYYFDEDIPWDKRKQTLDVNYRGTLAICQEFIPIMSKGARIVNVSSNSSLLKYYPRSIQARFRDPNKTLESIEELVQEYEKEVKADAKLARKNGWPGMTYFVSKAAENAITMILARENPQLYINCCCPGWVATDLGSQAGPPPKTVEEGAQIPIRLGFGDIGGVSGEYWSNATNRLAGEGAVAVW